MIEIREVKFAKITSGWIATINRDGFGYIGWGDTKDSALEELIKVLEKIDGKQSKKDEG